MKKLPAVLFLVGILIIITWLNFSTDFNESQGTPLRVFRLMLEEEQRIVILESRRMLFHKYLEYRYIERANCVARLFAADTNEGTLQFEEIEEYIDKEIEREVNQMTEEIVNKYIKINFCPST